MPPSDEAIDADRALAKAWTPVLARHNGEGDSVTMPDDDFITHKNCEERGQVGFALLD